MKQILLTLAGVFFINTAQSQELSYGLVLGTGVYAINNSGLALMNTEGEFHPNLGAYAEYNFTNNIGVKTEIAYTTKKATSERDVFLGKVDFDFSYIEITPAFKYDFGNEYRKGFYMTLGPRFSFMTSAKAEGIDDAKDLFKTMDIGGQLGLGYRLFRYFDLQAKVDIGMTPFFDIEYRDRAASFFGGYLSLNIDLERMINKS